MSKDMLRNKTCCFTGHRSIPEYAVEDIEGWVEKLVTALYCNYGICYFGSGGAMGFDIIAAEVVLRVAREYPEVKLIMVLPCPDHDKRWPQIWKDRLVNLKKHAAKTVFVSDRYHGGCMHARNRHLVDHSAWCIAYLQQNTGGTAYTVRYAEERGLRVFRYSEVMKNI